MASRKLQGEIERVLKKVDEGVQIFEQIWDKVYSAATTAQKEKYEGDLKKEIKKLQRLRDQIKTWQGDSSIKDKTKLDANRKLIEEKMEKFKICEKETKTKAFSKEGLMQDRTDPKQKAKAEMIDWLGDAIRLIQVQNEEMESEIETFNSGKRRKRGDDNPRVTELKEFMVRNERHIGMLERVLRAVDNDAISPEEVAELKESVDYYVESNQDPDFYEDDEMYDALNLDSVPAPTPTGRKSRDNKDQDDDAAPSPAAAAPTPTKKEKSPKHHTSASKRQARAAAANAAKALANSSPARKNPVPSQSPAPPPLNGPANAAPAHSPHVRPGGPLMSSVVKSGSAAAAAKQMPAPDNVARQIFKPPKNPAAAAAAAATAAAPASFSEPLKPPPQNANATPPSAQTMRWNGVVPGTTPAVLRQPAPSGATAAAATAQMPDQHLQEVRRKPPQAPSAPLPTPASATPQHQAPYAPRPTPAQHNVHAAGARAYQPSDAVLAEQSAALARAAQMLPDDWFGSSSFEHAPRFASGGADAATPAGSAMGAGAGTGAGARNPVNVPPSFPSVPSSVFDKNNIFLKFDPDTLFFIFYYQQGTLQQYLAARELKRQGWRFHKKYLTWFQRHDEPKVVNDEFETGTFIYFDYANVVFRGQGSGWCQRIKSEFVFEYRYLEDELQVQ